MNYLEKYEKWCKDPVFDAEAKKELESIRGNEAEIKDRFYQDLSFGTAGLRGVIGMGSNRMNKYTVTKATQGLANFILKDGGKERGVAISFDSRRMSPEFSEYTALCLNANGIKTYIMDSLRPVPELSFAVRELGCIAGIMITASHNPPEYNGYKVYWEDGAQIVAPKDKQIIEEVNKVEDFSTIKTMEKEEAIQKGLYHVIGKEIDEKYIQALKSLVLNEEAIKEVQKELKIVYTPLHGAGNKPVQRILKELGFENVYVVKEQEEPDGNFPTVDYPNPEDPKAFTLALELAKRVDADIVLATDPDSDRLGIFAKDEEHGTYQFFTGNMTALLIAEYELSQRKAQNKLPQNGAVIKTIVSSNLTDAIAAEYHMKLFEVLTGFKYIGEKIKQFEQNHDYSYMFGFEESYGCLVGTHARDKDAVVAVMALCEAAAFYKKQGLSLWEQMMAIYEKYGYYRERQFSVVLKGADGAEKIKQMMETMRKNAPTTIGKYTVKEIRDYSIDTVIHMQTKEQTTTGLPKSNVLYYDLGNGAWCCVRPSGTEPKIKFYIGVKEESMEIAEQALNNLQTAMQEFANA